MQRRFPDWWAALAADTAAELDARSSRQRYPRGAVLFVEGDPGHAVLVVQQGEVKASVTSAAGREVVLDVLGPGDVLGELAAIDEGPRSATVTALADIEVLSIPADAFRDIARRHPELLEALLRQVIHRLRASDRRQLEFGGDALGRVCARLAEMADRQRDTEIILPVNQSELAAWTGLSREAVVKALGALRRLGWISTDGRNVQLHDLAQLRARATT